MFFIFGIVERLAENSDIGVPRRFEWTDVVVFYSSGAHHLGITMLVDLRMILTSSGSWRNA